MTESETVTVVAPPSMEMAPPFAFGALFPVKLQSSNKMVLLFAGIYATPAEPLAVFSEKLQSSTFRVVTGTVM